jgi:signal transduction histidine kinase
VIGPIGGDKGWYRVHCNVDGAAVFLDDYFKGLIENGKNKGTLYIFSPTPEILKIKKTFYKVFVTASLFSLILTALLMYFYSKLLIKPITKLKHVSSEVAKGNYKEKINKDSNDELGDLAVNFNEMTKNLERLETARKDFIANASHEMRTPMTSIKGFIDAILDGVVPDDKVSEYLLLIKTEINRLNSMVTGMLDVARFDSDELILKKSIFDINDLLRSTIVKFEPVLIEKKLKVHANYQDKVQPVEADAEMIERVCLNLIDNSVKYTSMNGDIYVETLRKRNKVYVSIIDNGQGINLDEINLIWDRFYKTDTSRGVDKVGVGIGLSIVKKILDAHGESITVSSEPNIRTKFTFSLNAKG